MKPDPRIPILIDRSALRQAERDELVARRLHGAVDLGERRPGIALELDLDAERPVEAAPLQNAEHGGEVDMALADRREIPDLALAALVLEVRVNQPGKADRQVVDRLDAA